METAASAVPRLLAAAAASAEDAGSSESGWAFVWGIVSAVSLVIGAVIGIIRLPSQVTRATLMAFGGGALIEALSVELFAHILALAKGLHPHVTCPTELDPNVTDASGNILAEPIVHGTADIWLIPIAVLCAVGGGLLFAGLDRLLSDNGAALRKVATVKALIRRLRSGLLRRLVDQLRLVPMFAVLTNYELQKLAKSMVKQKCAKGEVIFKDLRRDSPIYFVVSGSVELAVTTKYGQQADGRVEDSGRLLFPSPVGAEEEAATHSWALSRMSLSSSASGSSSFGQVVPIGPEDLEAQRPSEASSAPSSKFSFSSEASDRRGFCERLWGSSAPRRDGTRGRPTPSQARRGAEGRPKLSGQNTFWAWKPKVHYYFTVGPNEIIGEMSLFTSETLQAKATALTDSTVLRIPNSVLHRLISSNPRMRDYVTSTATRHLRSTEVFRNCEKVTLARLATHMRQAEFEEGTVLFNKVDQDSPMYFIVLGKVEVTRQDFQVSKDSLDVRAGTKVARKKHVAGANSLIGSEHFRFGVAVNVQARVLERTTVLIMQRGDVDRLCEEDKDLHHALATTTSSKALGKDWEKPKPRGQDKSKIIADRLAIPEHELCEADGVVSEALQEAYGWSFKEDSDILEEAADIPSIRIIPAQRPESDSTVEHGALADTQHFDEAEDLPDLMENARSYRGKEDGLKKPEKSAKEDLSRGVQAATMIWLGILIDAVPESVVIGILVNTATFSTLLAFVVGVFLANLPEAMSSAGTMKLHGMKAWIIITMWASIMIMTGIGACVGAVVFPKGSEREPGTLRIIAAIDGLCGGAMLTMISNTVLPEAFEQGGNVTGLSCLSGFLTAILVSALGSYL